MSTLQGNRSQPARWAKGIFVWREGNVGKTLISSRSAWRWQTSLKRRAREDSSTTTTGTRPTASVGSRPLHGRDRVTRVKTLSPATHTLSGGCGSDVAAAVTVASRGVGVPPWGRGHAQPPGGRVAGHHVHPRRRGTHRPPEHWTIQAHQAVPSPPCRVREGQDSLHHRHLDRLCQPRQNR